MREVRQKYHYVTCNNSLLNLSPNFLVNLCSTISTAIPKVELKCNETKHLERIAKVALSTVTTTMIKALIFNKFILSNF